MEQGLTDRKVAIVTGASSGLGRATATLLAMKGWQVFGTSRAGAGSEGFKMVSLDVLSDDSVHQCVSAVLNEAGQIDLLVNNAGIVLNGLAEETPLPRVDSLFQTNFIGTVRMSNAVLPAMRAQGKGRIINVGSLAGLLGVPGQAFYSAVKHAIEGYSESIRYELEPFGILVSIIEPAFYRTKLHDDVEPVPSRYPEYDSLRSAVSNALDRSMREGGNPTEVAELIHKVASAARPGLRYRVGKGARWAPRLKSLMPERLFAIGLRRRFGLN